MSWIKNGNVARVMIPAAIFPQLVAGVPAARVYGALAMRADNRSGLSDSTIEQIAEDAGMSPSQVKTGLKRLLDDGWITKVRQGHSKQSNKYQLHTAPVNQPEIRPVDQSEIRPVIPHSEQPEIRLELAGNPARTSRKSGHPLVSPSLVSPSLGEEHPASRGTRSDGGQDMLAGMPESAPKPRNAGTLLDEWISTLDVRPPTRTVKQVGRYVKELLDDGISPEHVSAGLELWQQCPRNVSPASLHSFVHEAMNKRNGAPQAQRRRQDFGGYANDQDRRIAEFLGATGTDGPGLIALPGGQQ